LAIFWILRMIWKRSPVTDYALTAGHGTAGIRDW
jgi:hypothetical protein